LAKSISAPKTPLRLVQLTDSHLFADAGGALRGVPTLPALRTVLAAAAQDIARCDAILATGDLAQDDPDGYTHFREALAPLGKPVLCIPGNHDLPQPMRTALAQPPFELDGPVDLGAWRILLLDSTIPGQTGGRLGAAQLARLDRQLADAPERTALIALHHHPLPVGSRWLDALGLVNAAEFFAVLDRHPQVRAVVHGHAHQQHDAQRRGVRILGTPSTCAQFLPDSDGFAMDDRPPAWRRLALHGDGGVESSVEWVELPSSARH
jgi:Icc protein